MTFEDWYKELQSNSMFWDRMCLRHGSRKNLATIGQNVYDWLIAKEMLDKPMPECRTAFMKFAETHPNDAVKVTVNEEAPKKDEWKPVSWEERAEWLRKFQDMVDQSPMMKPVFKPTSKQLEEEGQVRPKATQYQMNELDMRLSAIENIKHLRAARRKTFLTAYPTAEEDEIQAYIRQFEKIDNPDGLII